MLKYKYLTDVRIMAATVSPVESKDEAAPHGYYRRAMGYTFFTDKKKVQIVVKMKDTPGSLASILDVLRKHVNLTSVEAHNARDGGPILSCFAEPLAPSETAAALDRLIRSSKAAVDVQVTEGSDGLLVDSFFKGIADEEGKQALLFTWEGANDMFDSVVEVFGTGGEVLLYREGESMGEASSKELVERIGKDAVARNFPMVLRMFTASGWGDASLEISESSGAPVIKVADCFECSSGRNTRQSCSFVRGLLTGSAREILGPDVAYEETKCRFRGDGHCEFAPVLDSIDKSPA